MEEDSAKAPSTVTFVLETADGTRESVALTGPGGKARVAVGRPGRRSGVWRVWANRGKSDVYVAARPIAGVQKFSLHESGDWRYQWVNSRHAEAFTAKPDRIVDRWPRPDEVAAGWTKALSIWIPQQDVPVIDVDDQTEDGVTWLPEPPEGRAIGIHVVVAKTNRGVAHIKSAVPFEAFTLANREVVVVLASSIALSPEEQAWLDGFRNRAMSAMAHLDDVDRSSAHRISVFKHDKDDGHRVVWDLAVPLPVPRQHDAPSDPPR